MVMARLSESLGPQQSVGEVEQQPRGHEGGERIIENHGSLLKACRRRMRSPPTARKSRARGPARSGPTFGYSFRHAVPGATRWRPCRCALTGVKSAKCFSPEAFLAPCEQRLRGTHRHKISTWKQGRRYRNLIKTRRHDLPMTRFIFGNNSLE